MKKQATNQTVTDLPLEVGDRVEILKEFRDPGDEDFTWKVIVSEEKGRVTIQPQETGLAVAPTYVVSSSSVRRLLPAKN